MQIIVSDYSEAPKKEKVIQMMKQMNNLFSFILLKSLYMLVFSRKRTRRL